LEAGAICYTLCKYDTSIAVIFTNHNAIGSNVVAELGDQEQKDRYLSKTINMEKFIGFGLTEPDNGSDATNMKTTAKKVEGGYIINGVKRWPGNGTFADWMIVWAKNLDQKNKI